MTQFHPLQDIDATAPGYDVSDILKTGALNRYYNRESNPFMGAPLVPIEETRPLTINGNGKLAPDAFDNLDSVEF